MEKLKNLLQVYWEKEILQLAIIFLAPLLLYLFSSSGVAFILFLTSFLVLYLSKRLNTKVKLVIAIVDLMVIMPLVGFANTYYLDVITQIGIYVVLAIGLNIVVGFTGLLNLGYVGFYAVGAYTYAIFATAQANNFITSSILQFPVSGNWFWMFLVIGMIAAGFVGFLLGLPVLRLRGDYLAIVTLGFAEIIRIVLNNLDKPINFTNGPKGLSPIKPPAFFGIPLNKTIHYYFIVLILLVITVIVVNRLNNSRIGRAWTAIREDELAARTMGIPIVPMKLLAFSIGAAFAGMMGVLFAAKQSFIDPSSFGFMESIGILAMVIMGGMGNIAGAIIGAFAVVVLQLHILKELSNFLRGLTVAGIVSISPQLDPAKYERLVFGLILVLMCIFRPQGFLPAKRTMAYIKKQVNKLKKIEKEEDVSVE
ncbi:amino acid/amide ABC transporter membrane protein 2, HAAT family (TC 3.A.1.4.-) [Natronincola peptidivorans]|uniref:Amino acid/amide ABC transporter membrane protein 2, HAAT family (TC 3.A.1.4.-) n=1 Tax=Natronincola peptidivorans TaxID=426128 RepID=A0A1H9ZK11_9FIRM|nr:branched-chain amino acid ABC transporter permease [Natronincola peptidivorans]SES81672.1 amino acid/amide ABC transporter membrane protein 2, HAAT family (TC 3.A.1.4.-) [Natronincola peptidivorans]